jgi:hypothetical protein
MFIWSWTEAAFHMHLYPEYLNALAAGLFYWAATLYRDDYAFTIQVGRVSTCTYTHIYSLPPSLAPCPLPYLLLTY